MIIMKSLHYLILACLFSSLISLGEAYSKPTAVLDPSYTTGTSVLVTSNWGNTSPTNFLVNYQTTMSTSSLNATLGVMGVNYYIKGTQWGWRLSIASLTQSSLNVLVNVKNYNNPIYYLKICYFVTDNTLLDINWITYSFSKSGSSTDPIANSSLAGGGCFIACRVYTTTQAFKSKTAGRVLTMLSGFDVNNNPQPPTNTTFFGITLQPTQPSSSTASSFAMNITVYGGAEVTFVSYYYISFEPKTVNIINYRLETDGVGAAIGCFYSINTCNPLPPTTAVSTTGLQTGKTAVLSYTQNNFIIGLSRMIMTWAGDTSTTAQFKISNVAQNSDSSISVTFAFTGNVNKQFQVAYNYFTLQTFYCPTVGIDIYAVYNSNACDSACNSSIQQYANSSNFCQPCGTYCWTCTGSANYCTGCYTSQNRINSGSGTCICDTAGGFYDDGSSVICPMCSYTCKTCSGGSSTNCLTCDSNSNRNFASNACNCNIGYYDGGASTCLACHYTCRTATCSSSSNVACLTCILAKYRTQLANFTCGCIAGYYDNSTSNQQCALCHYSCQTCWGSNSFCIGCNSANNRYLSLTDNTCRCNFGYYDNGIALCSKCFSTCYSCNGPLSTNCLTCDISLERTLVGTTCICGLRYYESNNLCYACSYTCLTCLSPAANNCTSCYSTALRTLNTTTATCNCYDGYFDSGIQLCTICSAACLTCINSANTCTSCHNNPGRYYSGSAYSCLCSSGYVDITFNGYCTLCHYSCITCSGTATNCVICAANRIWNGISCICPGSTYDDGIHPICQSCPSTCLTCNGGLSSTCTGCISAQYRYLSPSPTGACICSASYYDGGSTVCQLCSSLCLTCWGASTNCTSCDSTNNHRIISSNNNCVCATGFVDLGSTICIACITPCVTCSVLPNNCTSCSIDRTIASGSCVCNAGTFQNSSGLCQVCAISCATCISTSSNCLSCQAASNRAQLGYSCPCVSGYLQTNAYSCSPCSYTCASCNAFAAVCSSCPINSFRTLNALSACPCDNGYYDNGGSPTCLPCSKSCLTCTYYSLCQSCNTAQNRNWDSLNQACPCNTGYYDNGNASCAACHSSCAACSGTLNTNCITCQTNRNLSVTSCPCNNGLYDLLGTCTPCSLACKTCSISADNCTSCATGSYLSNYQCLCNIGYYLNGNICDLCNSNCYSCSGTSTSCTACVGAQGTALNGTVCQCPLFKYFSASSSSCISCDISCLTCSTSSKYACSSCSASDFRFYNSALLSCDCNSGYFDNSTSICSKCVNPCLTCNGGTPLNCTSCISGYNLIGSSCSSSVICPSYVYQGVCLNSCPNTTYSSGTACLTCTNHCLTCASVTFCTSCQSTYLLYNNTCVLVCPLNTYVTNSQLCSSCPSTCLQCTTYSNQLICLSCNSGYYLLNYTCTNACPIANGTHVLLGQNCFACLSPCKTCINLNSSGCTSCASGYSLYSGMCLNECPEGYLPNNNICTLCPSNCSHCDSDACLACNSGYYLTHSGNCSANEFFLDHSGNSIKCHANCMSCTNSSFSSCIACVQYRGDSSQMAISGYCDCWKNSVDLGNGICDIQSYKSLQSFTSFLVTSTTSTNYFSALSGIISMNFMASAMNIFYQQTYSNFYFINSSAVLQTDAVLDRYGDSSVSKFTKAKGGDNAGRDRYGRRLAGSQASEQDDESLFMRGSPFLYLVEWGEIVILATIVLWALLFLMKCIVMRMKPKVTNFYLIMTKISAFLNESAIILLFIFTFNEVTLYSFASFKIISKKYSDSIDFAKLIFSVIVFAYYIFYLLKLFVVNLKRNLSEEDWKKYRLMYAFFETNKVTHKICRIYLPMLLLRSLLLSMCIVMFSYSAQAQVITSIVIIILWDIYSFFACPYRFYVRLFIRFHELLFTLQILLLAISVANPENSRLGTAIAILVFNFIQVLVFIGLSISILLDKMLDIKCLKREENSVAPSKTSNQILKSTPKKSMMEDTMEELNEQDEKVESQKQRQMESRQNMKSIESIGIEDFNEPKVREPEHENEIMKKRYRVKRERKN